MKNIKVKKKTTETSIHEFLVRAGKQFAQAGEQIKWTNNIPASQATKITVDLAAFPNTANIFESGPPSLTFDIAPGGSVIRKVRATAAVGSGGPYEVYVLRPGGAITSAHGDSEPEVEVKG